MIPYHWSLMKKLIWLKKAVLSGAIWKTVTGSLIHITDALASPVNALSVNFDPVQDLHGYDNPWPAGGGGNLWNPSANPIEQGTISMGQDGNSQTRVRSNGYIPAAASTQYTFSANSDIPDGYIFEYADDNTMVVYSGWVSMPYTWTTNARTTKIRFVLRFAASGTNITPSDVDFVVINPGASAIPYSNICPISGWTGAKVTRTGKNLFDKTAQDTSNGFVAGRYLVSSGASYSGETLNTSEYISAKAGVQYTLSGLASYSSPSIVFYDAAKTYISGTKYNKKDFVTVTAPDGTAFLRFSITIATVDSIQLEIGDTISPYEAFNAASTTIPITFPTPPGTVYGGTLDVLSGVLTVDKVLLTFSGGATSEGVYGDDNAELYRLEIPNYNTTKIVRAQSTTSVGKLSSNYFKFISTSSAAKMKDAEIRTQAANTPQYLYFRWDSATDVSAINAAFANTALQVIGELQSPQTYQLTASEVSTLLGENNIWADTGDTTLTYMARG